MAHRFWRTTVDSDILRHQKLHIQRKRLFMVSAHHFRFVCVLPPVDNFVSNVYNKLLKIANIVVCEHVPSMPYIEKAISGCCLSGGSCYDIATAAARSTTFIFRIHNRLIDGART